MLTQVWDVSRLLDAVPDLDQMELRIEKVSLSYINYDFGPYT